MFKAYDRYVGQFDIYQAQLREYEDKGKVDSPPELENFESFHKEHMSNEQYNEEMFLN